MSSATRAAAPSRVQTAFAEWSDAADAQPQDVPGLAEDRWAARYNTALARVLREPCKSLSDLRFKMHVLQHEVEDGQSLDDAFRSLADDIVAMAGPCAVRDALIKSAPQLQAARDQEDRVTEARARLHATLMGSDKRRVARLRAYVFRTYGVPATVCLTDQQAVETSDKLMAWKIPGLRLSRAQMESVVKSQAIARGIFWLRENVFDKYGVRFVSALSDDDLAEVMTAFREFVKATEAASEAA
jgi:hypothetical protein